MKNKKLKCKCDNSQIQKELVSGTHNQYEIKVCIKCNTIISSKKI